MADLVARGGEDDQVWRRTLPATPIRLGRTSKSDWDVPWDKEISGVHATLIWQHGKLLVRKEHTARNRIFVRGSAVDEFLLSIGEQFVIGSTTFTLQTSDPSPLAGPPAPVEELTCSRQELLQVKYTDADQRIEVLAALPGIIRYSPSDEELESRVVDALLRGIPRADAVAVVCLDDAASPARPEVKVRRSGRRDGKSEPLQPSRRLIFDAIQRRRQSVMHRWVASQASEFTVSSDMNWAICAPLPDDPSPGWALYVAGHTPEGLSLTGDLADPDRHKSDLKFAELVADIFGSLRQVRNLQQHQTMLASFLSQPIRAALAERDMAEVLRPRETEVTVLFCDLRGSCQIAEESETDLMQTCTRLSESLGIMTTNIIDKDGVIGDFHGDAAMGFWGWPLDNADQIEQAARAALAIRRDFARLAHKNGHPLAGFTCGIGIATGTAVAGRLGTLDQFKVTVFGPVVNLASRLESMTRIFHVPILVDERVAQRLSSGRSSHWARCRKLAQVQPFGMRKTLLVNELLPPAVEPGAMAERDRRDYEAALEAFQAGRWSDSRSLLTRLPTEVGFFLRDYLDHRGPTPPADWDGVIVMETK